MNLAKTAAAATLALLAACGAPSGVMVSPNARPVGGNLYIETSLQGRQFLVLDGEITPETSYTFQALVEQAEQAAGLVITQSPGGNLFASHQIGDTIAAHHMNTAVIGECISACVHLFIAGNERDMTPDAVLGLHPSSGGAYTLAIDERYWGRFGLADVIRAAYKVPKGKVWYIGAERAKALKLATQVLEPPR